MKGDIVYKILGFLEDKSVETVDLVGVFLSSGYGATLSTIDFKFKAKQKNWKIYKFDREKKRRLQKYLSRLKNDGLIFENSTKKISLSFKGKKKLRLLKKNKILDKSLYKKESGNRVIVISYDIPVSFNKERNTLREVLRTLGFSMVHKSVWMGRVKLPKSFIIALKKLDILEYVEILEVTKSGSLKSI